MRYLALACDYDGTLATDGKVDQATIAALERVRASGRKLLMVSGRELEDLQRTFDHLDLFDLAVLENGALLYYPDTKQEKIIGERPPDEFVALLRARDVAPMSVGRVIVATWEPHQQSVLDTIRDLGLELQVIFNKGAVMILPSGINKATGLKAALAELNLSPHNCIGVGDAENDHAFLSLCECGVAVSNALPMLKERADWVTESDHGRGVAELIDRLLADDLSSLEERLSRYDVLLGTRKDADSETVKLKPYGLNLMIAGTSQGGKTTLAMGIIERLMEQGYQLCILDPEGDYSELEGAVALGDSNRVPSADEIIELLGKPSQNAVVNLLGISLEHRPDFFAGLLPRLLALRSRTGRPHWIIIDETHHLLPAEWNPASFTLPQDAYGLMLITLEPNHVAPSLLASVDTIIAIGGEPDKTIATFCQAINEAPPAATGAKLERGEALVWSRGRLKELAAAPVHVVSTPPTRERRRHHRKYAEGELAPEWSFYFKGPEEKLNLRAQNLVMFLQLAEGVDDETWRYHLRRKDYSVWFRNHIKDAELADEAEIVEKDEELSAQESRARIRQAIEKRYTAPA